MGNKTKHARQKALVHAFKLQGDFYETCQATKYNKDTEVQVQSGTRWADFPEDRNSAMAAGSGKAARHLAAILLNSSTHVKSPPPT
jgi:hypothetical protein